MSELKGLKDNKETICSIEGSYLNNLIIDGKTYWDCESQQPKRQLPIYEDDEMVLCSDWRFREDLLWLKYNYQLIAH